MLELVTSSPTPSKVYDLFSGLRVEYARITPATVYRSLAWLEGRGLVRKIETMHAYIACIGEQHFGQVIFVCDRCRHVFEFADPSLTRRLAARASRFGFEMRHEVLEAHGVCVGCRTARGQAK